MANTAIEMCKIKIQSKLKKKPPKTSSIVSKFTSPKERLFVLSDIGGGNYDLKYYRDETDFIKKTEIATIDLKEVMEVKGVGEKELYIKMEENNSRGGYELIAETQETRDAWVKVLGECLAHLKPTEHSDDDHSDAENDVLKGDREPKGIQRNSVYSSTSSGYGSDRRSSRSSSIASVDVRVRNFGDGLHITVDVTPVKEEDKAPGGGQTQKAMEHNFHDWGYRKITSKKTLKTRTGQPLQEEDEGFIEKDIQPEKGPEGLNTETQNLCSAKEGTENDDVFKSERE